MYEVSAHQPLEAYDVAISKLIQLQNEEGTREGEGGGERDEIEREREREGGGERDERETRERGMERKRSRFTATTGKLQVTGSLPDQF